MCSSYYVLKIVVSMHTYLHQNKAKALAFVTMHLSIYKGKVYRILANPPNGDQT